ncbi:MAG: FHA domain-containing protein [Myxococcales bacterium]|nr:FHA domain-containing protein [Myxococcota bacterium]MDW8282499.1 FHA domain-containing protein [Myxococcales bacterium]
MAKLTLIVTRGGEIRRHPIREERPMLLGRGSDVDILVADVSISRHQLTVKHAGDALEFEVSPQSRNQVLLNGRPVQAGTLRPGDRLAVGYCSFELMAEAEVPQARPARVPPDPAGHIDVSLAEEEQRIAPRWMASIEDAKAQQPKKERATPPKPKTLLEKMVLPAMLVLLAGLGYLYYQRTRPVETLQPPERLDLFADVPAIDCGDPEECFNRAKRAYELGVKLSEQSGADPATLYKAARQFQMAAMALKGQMLRLPELQPRLKAARQRVIEAFEDARLRLVRAQQEGNASAALAAIEEQLVLLQDSKHPYKDQLLRARVRVMEVRDQARREAISSGRVR